MVAIYFDQAFIKIFGERTDFADPVIQDFFNQFIKKIRGVKVFVNIGSIYQLNELIENNEFYALISEISSIKISDFKRQLSDDSFYEEGEITKLFFIENCDEKKLQDNYNYYFISNKTLKDKWKLFVFDREDRELIIKSNPQPSELGVFRSWKDLNLFSHKIKNILIFDKYVMSNKSNQKINNNILPCIRELIKSTKGKVDELTIFTLERAGSNNKPFFPLNLWLQKDFEIACSYFEPISRSIKNISLVKYDKGNIANADPLHNRFILTNYFYIRPEAGINIFRDNGTVNHGDTIRFDSILRNNIREIVKEALKNLKQYTSNLDQIGTIGNGLAQVEEHYFYYPAINCKFLK